MGFGQYSGDATARASLREMKQRALQHGADKTHINESKLIARNTIQFAMIGDRKGIVYHHTLIIVTYPEGAVWINTDGYRTITTRDRLRRFLPAGIIIYSERGAWYVRTHVGSFPYHDEIIITPSGWPDSRDGKHSGRIDTRPEPFAKPRNMPSRAVRQHWERQTVVAHFSGDPEPTRFTIMIDPRKPIENKIRWALRSRSRPRAESWSAM